MSNLLSLYTQNNCPFCVIMKDKLDDWGMNYEIINISEDASGKDFLKSKGHRTVPQLYFKDVLLNTVDTVEFTLENLLREMRESVTSKFPCEDSGVEDMS